METRKDFIERLENEWRSSPRWKGITRPYSSKDVYELKGSIPVEHTITKVGASRLWRLLQEEKPVCALSAVTGNQAIQEVQAGLKAIYVSGWQVAADMNEYQNMYPDQSIYPSDSVPALVRRINNALLQRDKITHLEGKDDIYWLAPIVADAEAGFGEALQSFELMRNMIEAGASGVHYEDQLASVKKCGHLGGKVIVPTSEFIRKLIAARLASDVSGVDTVLIARTDAGSASLLTSDIDPYDRQFIDYSLDRTHEGFYHVKASLEQAIARALAYAQYSDLLWFETSTPAIGEARKFAEAIHKKYPGKLLAYNCSPSFNWKAKLPDKEIANFQKDIGKMGYKFQFVTLSAFHVLNHSMFQLAKGYKDNGMVSYSKLQEEEFQSENDGYDATSHQQFVGTGYFDKVTEVVSGGLTSVSAMKGSTEEDQFKKWKT